MAKQAELVRIPWKPIAPLDRASVLENGALGALDALRAEWQRRLNALTEEERASTRQRSLRRMSVETGILERLYHVEWGLTLTLVAEGFTRDVVERAGGAVDDRILATLRAQMDSLGMVLDFVRADRALTPSFIKELHQAITRTQETYDAIDALGRAFNRPLPRGEWKRDPNHVLRQNNTLLEYAPPEHVASEVDRLVELWRSVDADNTVHPLVKAAWLHHRFVQIHPFADGNGRVARALTLLVLEKHRYAPLVVDRWHRVDYLKALDAANDGDLAALTRLFVRLESAALAAELERPPEPSAGAFAVDVAHTLADQIAKIREQRASHIQRRLHSLAVAVGGRMGRWFDRQQGQLGEVFEGREIQDATFRCATEMPPSPQAQYYRRQIIDSARTAGHYADFSRFAGWASLRAHVEGLHMQYVASLHGAGREPGVMAVTTFAEVSTEPKTDGDESPMQRDYVHTTKDGFYFAHTESVEALDARGAELEELLDEGLAVALAELLKRL